MLLARAAATHGHLAAPARAYPSGCAAAVAVAGRPATSITTSRSTAHGPATRRRAPTPRRPGTPRSVGTRPPEGAAAGSARGVGERHQTGEVVRCSALGTVAPVVQQGVPR